MKNHTKWIGGTFVVSMGDSYMHFLSKTGAHEKTNGIFCQLCVLRNDHACFVFGGLEGATHTANQRLFIDFDHRVWQIVNNLDIVSLFLLI